MHMHKNTYFKKGGNFGERDFYQFRYFQIFGKDLFKELDS